MARRTKEEKDDVTYYATQKDLIGPISRHCYTKEQVDTALRICSYIADNKAEYQYWKEKAFKNPEREYESADLRQRELSKFLESTGQFEKLAKLSDIKLSTPKPKVSTLTKEIKEQVEYWIDDDGTFSPNQKTNLTRAILTWFKS